MIHLSATAIAEIRRLQFNCSRPIYCRLGVQAGGCADWYYTLELDELSKGSDRCFDVGEVQVIVNHDALTYIKGITVDYSEDLMGGGFRFHNPNATRNCGCGNSFSINSKPHL